MPEILTKKRNGLARKLAKFFSYRPTSYPYLSGDTFRNYADHIHEVGRNLNPNRIVKNDIVFVESPRLREYFETIHPQITEPYILITHNGDQNITAEYTHYISDTIIHWFAQNCGVVHPKISPLPIGLENKWHYLHGIPSSYTTLRAIQPQKALRILYKFNVRTNPTEREAALLSLTKNPLASTYADWRESFSYLTTLQNHAFVASPPGNGEDCIRTWESMYLKTVPILKRSILAEYFQSLGLPIHIIDSWQTLESLTESDLQEIYATMQGKWDSSALWADFWITQINGKKI